MLLLSEMLIVNRIKLSDRVRANSEADPWVIDEIERLEADLESALCELYNKEDDLVACTNLLIGFSHSFSVES